MLSRENCPLRSSLQVEDHQVCKQLQVVEDAKTDMEYNCHGCMNK